MKKICLSCAAEKPIEEFHRHRGRRDGRNDVCKECANYRVSRYSKTEGAKAVRAKYFAEYKERQESRDKLQDYHRAYAGKLSPEQREKYAETRRRREKSSPKNTFYRMLFSAAKRRPTKNIATVDDLMEMFEAQKGLCAISGVKMDWASNRQGKKLATSISLDRIDGSKGYEKENLRFVCWQVNLFKNCWSDQEMLTMAKRIVNHMDPEQMHWIESNDDDRAWIQ